MKLAAVDTLILGIINCDSCWVITPRAWFKAVSEFKSSNCSIKQVMFKKDLFPVREILEIIPARGVIYVRIEPMLDVVFILRIQILNHCSEQRERDIVTVLIIDTLSSFGVAV